MPTYVLANRSLFDCLFLRSPDYHFLCTFGCLCFPFLRPYNNLKLDFHSSSWVFLGYSSSHLGYRCFDIASQRIYISCHVRFHEHVFPFDNYKQIAKVSSTPPTQTATNVLPNLLCSPLFPIHTALPPQTAHLPQHSPLPCPSSHACLSNHSDTDTACKSVTPTSSVTLLLVLGQPLVLPLLLLIWPVSKLLPALPLLNVSFLPPVLYLRQILP
jgi:histone deacetylase 1/2